MELSVLRVKNQFWIEYDSSIVDFLETIYMAGAICTALILKAMPGVLSGATRCLVCWRTRSTFCEPDTKTTRCTTGCFSLGHWGHALQLIMASTLPSIDFANFNSVILTIIGVCALGAVMLIVLILTLILAWNYIKLLFEAAERYVLLGVMIYTAPNCLCHGSPQSTSNIFKSWCRMFGGQVFSLLMNAWCLRLFISMVGAFIANPLSL